MSDTITINEKTTIIKKISNWADIHLNAIMLRDLRIFLRSKRTILIFFIGLFLAQYITLTILLSADNSSESSGKNLFFAIIVVMGFILTGIIPYITYTKFSEEMRSRSTELVIGSGLKPSEIIRGKLYCAMIITSLFCSAVLPIMVVAYLLGGINIFITGYLIAILLLLSLAANSIAILFASLTKKRKGTILGAGFIIFGFFTISILGNLFDEIQRPKLLSNIEFIAGNIGTIIHSLLVLGFFYIVAIKRLSFANDNKDYLPRIYLYCISIGCIIISLILYKVMSYFDPSVILKDFIIAGTIIAILTFGIGCIFILNTPNNIAKRILDDWQKSRLTGLLLYPGAGRLYLFILSFYLPILIASGCYFESPFHPWNNETKIPFLMTTSAISALFAGFVFHNIVFKLLKNKNLQRYCTRTISFFIAQALWILVVLGVYIAMHSNSHSSAKYVLLFNPFSGFTEIMNHSRNNNSFITIHLGITAVCLTILGKEIIHSIKDTLKLCKKSRQDR